MKFRIIILLVSFLVFEAYSIPKPMESLEHYNVLMVHGAYGSDKGISENSEYVSAYEDTTFLGDATLGIISRIINNKLDCKKCI